MFVSTIPRHQCVRLLESKIKCTIGLESLRKRNLLCSFRISNESLLRMVYTFIIIQRLKLFLLIIMKIILFHFRKIWEVPSRESPG